MKSRFELYKKIKSYNSCPNCGSTNLVMVDEYFYEQVGWMGIYECQGCRYQYERAVE